MNPTLELTEQQYAEIESQVNNIVGNNSKSTNELYSIIGKGLYYSNDVELNPRGMANLFSKTGMDHTWLTTHNAIKLLSETPSISRESAIESGKDFWERLKEKIQHEICTNKTIQDFFLGSSTLSGALKVIIPIILAAIGISIINPLILAAIAAVIALIIKIGYKAYCNI